MSNTTDRYRAEILDGHRDRQIRRLRLRGTVIAGDGSRQKGGGMVAGYTNLRGGKKRQQRKDRARTVGFRNQRPLSWHYAASL